MPTRARETDRMLRTKDELVLLGVGEEGDDVLGSGSCLLDQRIGRRAQTELRHHRRQRRWRSLGNAQFERRKSLDIELARERGSKPQRRLQLGDVGYRAHTGGDPTLSGKS